MPLAAQQVYIDYQKGEQLVVFRSGTVIDSVWYSDGAQDFELFATPTGLQRKGDTHYQLKQPNTSYRLPMDPEQPVRSTPELSGQVPQIFVPKTTIDGNSRAPIRLLDLYDDELIGTYVDVKSGDRLHVGGSKKVGFTFQIQSAKASGMLRFRPLTFDAKRLLWVLRPTEGAGFHTLNYLELNAAGRYFEYTKPDKTQQRFTLQ